MKRHISIAILLVTIMAGFSSCAKKTVHEGPVETVVAFLKWYRSNYEKLAEIPIIDTVKTQNSGYRVNLENAQRYITVLKSSGMLSQKYLNRELSNFKRLDRNLQKKKRKNQLPEDFDVDRILYTKKVDQAFKEIDNNLRIIEHKIYNDGSYVIVDVHTRLQFNLKKNKNGIWEIIQIRNIVMSDTKNI